jgi:hypothetical protein
MEHVCKALEHAKKVQTLKRRLLLGVKFRALLPTIHRGSPPLLTIITQEAAAREMGTTGSQLCTFLLRPEQHLQQDNATVEDLVVTWMEENSTA